MKQIRFSLNTDEVSLVGPVDVDKLKFTNTDNTIIATVEIDIKDLIRLTIGDMSNKTVTEENIAEFVEKLNMSKNNCDNVSKENPDNKNVKSFEAFVNKQVFDSV